MFQRIKKNYHWVIAAVALIQLFFHSGAGNNFTNLHLIPVSDYLGIERAEFSVAYSTKNLMGMLFTFISGAILNRLGYKRAASLGMLIAAAMYFLLAGMGNHSYPLLFVYCGGIGITNALCSTSAVTKIITDWFHKHKGMVLGAVSAATGLGGSILCLAQTGAMEKFGTWRASFILCGIGILIGGILIFLFIRNEPKEMGLTPYGEGEEIVGKKKRISQNAKEGLSMKHLSRRPSFYLMILFTFLSCACVYMAFLVILPFFKDQGFSSEQASYLNSYLLLALAASKFIMGIVIDRVGAKKVTIFFHIFVSLGLILLCVSKNFIVGIIALTVFAMGIPLITINVPLLAFSLFGYKAQAQYTGIFMGMISAASMVINIFTNYLFDTLGTYSYGFLGAAGASILLIAGYLILYRMADKDPKADPQ